MLAGLVGLALLPGCGSSGPGAGSGGAASGGGIGAGGSGGTLPASGGTSGGGAVSGGAPASGGSASGGAASGGTASGGTASGGAGTGTGGVIVGDLPLYYDLEFTGEACEEPALPAYDDLPETTHLPDPFLMSSGEPMTSRTEWACRRAEIKALLEEYDVGEKPGKPSTVDATLEGNTLHITVGEGGQSFEMTAPIIRPAGAPDGPIPAIIGINTTTGSLPANVFSSRGIATITFSADQVASTSFSGPPRNGGNFYGLYPGATAGFMIRWAWGVSRIVDALYALPEANIDLSHIAVSGCSYQGKVALYAGAFDERIALTIPHESGGGGTISWRYSDMLEERDNTEVENLMHAQGAPWYAEALMDFTTTPNKLPFDHHELIGLVAPRALLAIESTNVARMGAEAARIDALAARRIYEALGVPFRLGATEENTSHCVWHDGFTPDLEAYVDKFLLGQEDVDTDILRSKFTDEVMQPEVWIPWATPTLL
jgi:hypothetical protein